ncbi:hypothetical protein K439DRAFT_233621 [Ramaria rubella]|nr:hypothetical protein K439DRAFT_233621 [Ramaria rubella]
MDRERLGRTISQLFKWGAAHPSSKDGWNHSIPLTPVPTIYQLNLVECVELLFLGFLFLPSIASKGGLCMYIMVEALPGRSPHVQVLSVIILSGLHSPRMPIIDASAVFW